MPGSIPKSKMFATTDRMHKLRTAELNSRLAKLPSDYIGGSSGEKGKRIERLNRRIEELPNLPKQKYQV